MKQRHPGTLDPKCQNFDINTIMNVRDVGIKKDFILLRILLQIADLYLGDVDEDVYRGVCSEHQVVPPAHIPVTRAASFSL